MIRVLQIVSSMDRGGLETFIMNLYRNIDRKKIQFDFLLHTEKECDYNSEIRGLGGKIYVIPARNKGIIKNRKALNLFFKEHPEYKIIHMHESSLSYIEPLSAAKRMSVPVRIMHSHSTGFAKGNKIHRLLHRIHKNNIDSIATNYFACSAEAGQWFFGGENSQVKFIKNGIESEMFIFNPYVRNEYRKQLGIDQKLVIGHVGRFVYPKNHLYLIDIFYEVSKMDENAVLLLVGDGVLKESVQKKIEDYHIRDKVIFLGVRDDISKIMQAMDIFVFPSIYEGLPVTLVEAQAAGLKCVVSNNITRQVILSDLIECIDLKKDPTFWAEEICKFVNYNRVNMHELIKINGFDIRNMAELLQQFYLKAMNQEKL